MIGHDCLILKHEPITTAHSANSYLFVFVTPMPVFLFNSSHTLFTDIVSFADPLCTTLPCNMNQLLHNETHHIGSRLMIHWSVVQEPPSTSMDMLKHHTLLRLSHCWPVSHFQHGYQHLNLTVDSNMASGWLLEEQNWIANWHGHTYHNR